MGESVTIKVNLDIAKSKRDIEEQKKTAKEVESTLSRLDQWRKGRQKHSWTTFSEGREFKEFEKILDPEARRRASQRSFNRYAFGKDREDPSGDFALSPSGLAKATGVNKLTPKGLLGEELGGTVQSGLVGGATLYAGLRLGNTIGIGLLEAIKGAVPGVENLPGFGAIQNQIEGIAKAMDNFENRILGIVSAASSTYQLGKAGANISGGQPIEYSIYAGQDYKIAVAEGDLDRAFDRFKYKNLARSLGELTAEAFKRASQ